MSDSSIERASVAGLGVLFALAALSLVFIHYDGLSLMVSWWGRDEYSHGYLIPIIAAFLVWQKWDELAALSWRGAWAAIAVLVVALAIFLLGELSALYTLVQYAFWVALVAICLAAVGYRGIKLMWGPLVYLLFMIPLPNFLYNNLSQDLQLISSQLGAWVIRQFGISVYPAGNVIDLGIYQLQVVEACSGLRYLFPLMSFGFLAAYLYKAPLWQRAVLFLSTVPITILMNSFRIGVIGILVEYWGIGMADGFLHYFEGWLVFMACLGVLFLEVLVFHRFSKAGGSVWDRFDTAVPQRDNANPPGISWQSQRPLMLCLVILLVAAPASVMLDKRQEAVPQRELLHSFPLDMGNYLGTEGYIESAVIDSLKLTDYLIADYRDSVGSNAINLYIAYYESQRKGASIHSPRSCIPGDGWQIDALGQREIPSLTTPGGEPMQVNRVVIKKGSVEQLVYYWFQQRGRIITNEYLAKWFIFWDALTKNRTDGALIRVVAPVFEGQEQSVVDARLVDFIRQSYPLMGRYVPD